MNFQIDALPEAQFTHLFAMSDDDLADHQACRQIVTSKPGTPCRVSMADSEIGETVILVNFAHLPVRNPFQATHAIFVREHAKQAELGMNDIPEVIQSRLMSIRLFDLHHMMIDADVVAGSVVGLVISNAFDTPEVAFIHLHYAKQGCFAASVRRFA